jgi:predicted molibdopterin-dependent oxidoreductase YjgC
MSPVSITVDGQKVKAEPGSRLLWAILEAGIWVPNLCAIKELEPPDGEPLADQDCGECTRCAEVCPTHAIWKK